MSSSRMKLGYWNVRGLAAPIRYLLAYVGADFEEVRYGMPGAPEWSNDKVSLGMEFPNLPYLFDGPKVRLTQSLAILRYLGRKFNLDGIQESSPLTPSEQQGIVDMVEQQLHDLRMAYVYYGLDNTAEVNHVAPEGFKQAIPRLIRPFAARLEANEFLFGPRVSYVDFLLFEVLDVMRLIIGDRSGGGALSSLGAPFDGYLQRVSQLGPLKAYLESERHVSWPVLGPPATKWGYHKQ